ncbi:MAG: ATP-binding protein [Clostridia bacterium]|nr:ATP-binding protein [Clostridia bacterium]NCC83822.1 ATP-binding protein [Clostridia bacterium]
MIIRNLYLERLRDFYHSDLIKVISGIRRCGKSELINQIQAELRSQGIPESQIIYLNMEEMSNIRFQDPVLLNEFILKTSADNPQTYLFLDEVQFIEQFERLINSLRSTRRYSIFITGSNSTLLSGKLATLLTGRTMTIQMFPFTFSEAAQLAGISKSQEADFFLEYLKWGGLPQRFEFTSEQSRMIYLEDVLNSIVYRDVMVDLKRADKTLTERLLAYIYENTANIFSDHSIYEQIRHQMDNAGKNKIYELIERIEQAMLVQKCRRYDIQGKQVLVSLEKYYCTDLGLRSAMHINSKPDYGKLLETMIFLELKARGLEVYVGKTYKGEVDFLVIEQNQRRYVQVAWSLAQDTTQEREFGAFAPIPDNFPRYVISNDREDYSQNGIRHLDAIEFLMHRIGF